VAKPDHLPVLRRKDAKELAEYLEKRRARREAKRLFPGALAELDDAKGRRRLGTPAS
jgi:hypothetical protein